MIYDEEEHLFKCWYAGTDLSVERWWATGYAISDDGVHWEKPRLGLHEYRGNRDNNICLMAWGPIVKDADEESPARRYKMIIKGPPRERGIRAGYSPDGIHWSEETRIDLPEWEGRTPDIVALIKDDQDPDPTRRFKLIWQSQGSSNKRGPETVRTKNLAFGPDAEHFTASAENPVLHPNDGLEQETHYLMLAPYAGQYVMPYEYGWYAPNGTGVYGAYCADIRLAVGRDGEHFTRVRPDQKVIARGPRGAWDDGFTCLETSDRETPGYAVTQPIDVRERDVRLLLNLSEVQVRRSWVDVEVLPPSGDQPLAGFGRDDCLPLHRDGLREQVVWRDRRLADLDQTQIRLRFNLFGAARLHSFTFAA